MIPTTGMTNIYSRLAQRRPITMSDKLGLHRPTPQAAQEAAFTPSTIRWFQIMSLVSSVVNLLIVAVTLWIYALMPNRTFRRHLLILLTAASASRSVLLVAYAARMLAVHKTIDGMSVAACRTIGWLLSFSFEAEDIGTLAVALHTAMLVLSPEQYRQDRWYGGLFRFRGVVYVVWIAVPILVSSLAFVDAGGHIPKFHTAEYGRHAGYEDSIIMCYLPVQPIWYRLALSWVPRLLVFLIITLLYIYVYFYVRRLSRRSSREIVEAGRETWDTIVLPPEPGHKPKDTVHDEVIDTTDVVRVVPLDVVSSTRRLHFRKRFIFVYPIVYLALLIPALLSQIILYLGGYMIHARIGINVSAILAICLSGSIYSAAFLVIERPPPSRQAREHERQAREAREARAALEKPARRCGWVGRTATALFTRPRTPFSAPDRAKTFSPEGSAEPRRESTRAATGQPIEWWERLEELESDDLDEIHYKSTRHSHTN
ncbi:G protein-coupled glucose receptor regulating Gpa2-domain-containing protein [Dipodascopsis tothii]|uniref:G protein-coupled glucose receptor regulating Gpa2-domain-containing protein n=1 Tax=Dipodascopsis tothii TaxID=44089 RepID=UPI0034CDC907